MALIPLAGLSAPAYSELVERGVPIVIPVGAVEVHGPHLPLGTDLYEVMAVLEGAARSLEIVICPPLAYGVCSSTGPFPGTLRISFDTLRGLARDLAGDLLGKGATKVAFFSGHAGRAHMEALKLGAAEALSAAPEGSRVLVLSPFDLLEGTSGLPDIPRGDSHAGMLETSLMMAIAPQLVAEGAVVDSPSRPPKNEIVRNPQRYFPSGVMGYPSRASSEAGEAILSGLVEAAAAILADLAASRDPRSAGSVDPGDRAG